MASDAGTPRQPRLIPIVRSLDDAMRWLEHSLSVTLQDHLLPKSRSLETLVDVLRNQTMSSAFSGVGTAETVLTFIQAALKFYTGESAQPRSLFAFELSEECRYELQMGPLQSDCLFGDIKDLLQPHLRELLEELSDQLRYEEMVKIMLETKGGALRNRAWCYVHKQLCSCKKATTHWSGEPCVDHSSQGKQQGLGGKTMLVHLVWVAQRLLLEEDGIFHENAKKYPWDTLLDEFNRCSGEFSQRYFGESIILRGSDLGQLAERERRLTWFRHKRTVKHPIPWPLFVKEHHRERTATWEALFVAPAEELKQEFLWASKRPGSKSRSLSNSNNCDDVDLNDATLFEKALTSQENSWRKIYFEMHGPEPFVCALNQDPLLHPTHNAGKAVLHCLIRDSRLQWSSSHRRWLSPKEALLAQQWPAYPDLAMFGETCCFLKAREDFGFPTRRRGPLVSQAGNGQPLNFIGLAWLHWLLGECEVARPTAVPRPLTDALTQLVLKRRKSQ